MRHDINNKIIGLPKTFSTIVAAKNYKQKLIHSPPTTKGVQTLLKLTLGITQKQNVTWK